MNLQGLLLKSTHDAELYQVSAILDMQYSIDIENYKIEIFFKSYLYNILYDIKQLFQLLAY